MAESLFLLLPISLVFVIAIGVFFWWAIFSGQFDDVQSGGDAILLDHDMPPDDPTSQQAQDDTTAQRPAAMH
ncbi:cbb3-type cytochrome oxidase assembly protein CcoS [Alcaligenaceae bacterium]|nr:cbb3-type cytochrome oxidase assembly protein CcoS [Alcaligenaceae bacterium]